jgi:hypothetical protein
MGQRIKIDKESDVDVSGYTKKLDELRAQFGNCSRPAMVRWLIDFGYKKLKLNKKK